MNTQTTPFEAFAAEMRALTAKMRENGAITIVAQPSPEPKEKKKMGRPSPHKTVEERNAHRRARDKKRRERLIASGLCIFHATIPAKPGYVTCEKCSEKARLRYPSKNMRNTKYRKVS